MGLCAFLEHPEAAAVTSQWEGPKALGHRVGKLDGPWAGANGVGAARGTGEPCKAGACLPCFYTGKTAREAGLTGAVGTDEREPDIRYLKLDFLVTRVLPNLIFAGRVTSLQIAGK